MGSFRPRIQQDELVSSFRAPVKSNVFNATERQVSPFKQLNSLPPKVNPVVQQLSEIEE